MPAPARLFSTRQAFDLAQLLRAAARAEIMPRFRHLGAGAVRSKAGPLDLVTDADEAAEALIEQGLTRLFPGCVVVGEERAAREPALLDRLAAAELAFAVDPLDGTANFAAGLPLFGTMAAAVVRGEVAGAVIHDPVTDSCTCAVRGEGAWEEAADGTRAALCVAAPVPLGEMSGTASWRYLAEPLRTRVMAGLPRLGQVWDHRCAAHEYRLLAAGHCHFLLFNRLLPWDHLPGVLLVTEAGGYAARFDGSAYRPGQTGGGLISAPDRDSWTALRDCLLG